MFDIDGDDTDDHLGGTIINPAQTTTRYVDETGNELRISDLSVSPRFASYLVSDNPTSDVGPDSYYLAGQSYTATAPYIDGYITPSSQVLTLDRGNNTVTFVYSMAATSPEDPIDDTPPVGSPEEVQTSSQ